jgi:hypothetical protein
MILVMKSTDNRLHAHAIAVANPMAARRRCEWVYRRIGNARPETRVRTSVIVVRDPLVEHASQDAYISKCGFIVPTH